MSTAIQPTTTAPNDAASELFAVVKRYEACVNAADADAANALYTDDATWMPPGDADRTGRASILSGERALFGMNLALELRPDEVRLLGRDAGLVRLTASGTAHPPGAPEPKPVRFSAIFLLARRGAAWRISHKIWKHTPAGA